MRDASKHLSHVENDRPLRVNVLYDALNKKENPCCYSPTRTTFLQIHMYS